MNINIEKIVNGYVVSIDGKKTFCSEGMSICGLLAEWANAEVERLEKQPTYGEAAKLTALQAAAAAGMISPEMFKRSLLGDWDLVKRIVDDQP